MVDGMLEVEDIRAIFMLLLAKIEVEALDDFIKIMTILF